MRRALLGLIICWLTQAQTPDLAVKFEVASVKPAQPHEVSRTRPLAGCVGGPGTSDPGHFTCYSMTVRALAAVAYHLYSYQMKPDRDAPKGIIFGPMPPIGYDVIAKVPAGATQEQCRIMLQNLLIERFRFAYHFERRDSDTYELVVAKNGAKLKEAADDSAVSGKTAEPAADAVKVTGRDANGCPVYSQRRLGLSTISLGPRVCVVGAAVPMEEFILRVIHLVLNQPITDGTGLKGRYDFNLTFSGPATMGLPEPPDVDAGPSLFSALQEQLGLRLERKKGSIDFFVIDHVEKPTAN